MKWYYIAPLILQKLIWIPSRVIFTVFAHLKIVGLENLKSVKGNVIFATNHASELDPFLTPTSLPFFSRFSPLFYAVREKSFYDESGWRKHLFGGTFINMWGGYPVYVGLHDYEKSLPMHIRIIKEGGSMCLFPEGGISPDGKVQPAKGGLGYLIERTSCIVIPVGISGTYNTSVWDFFTGKRHVTVTFGGPITADEIKQHVPSQPTPNYKEMANYIMGKVKTIVE